MQVINNSIMSQRKKTKALFIIASLIKLHLKKLKASAWA